MRSHNPPGENSTEVFSFYFYRVLCYFISKKKSRDSVGNFFTVYYIYTYIFPCFYSSTMPFSRGHDCECQRVLEKSYSHVWTQEVATYWDNSPLSPLF